MSRIGKQPITLPDGVTATVSSDVITVKGKVGELNQSFDALAVTIEVADGAVNVANNNERVKAYRAKHGLYRSLIANMVTGCSVGFKRELEINGVGYQAKVVNNKLDLAIGFCHPVYMDMPAGVTIEAPSSTRLVISGADKQAVGQVAANIRRIRPPEPYKGKGIKYNDEVIVRKAGKAVGAG